MKNGEWMLPNFICPGAQKSATTTLHDVLATHPDIFLPAIKETHFFSNEEDYRKGIDWYRKRYYKNVQKEKAVGDITPLYMYLEHVPERIYQALGPDVKFVFMLRDPVERAYSHYLMNCRWGKERMTFLEAIKSEPQRIRLSFFHRIHFSYVDRGFYTRQISRFLTYYPVKQMKFVIFENFTKNKQVITEIMEFLGIKAEIATWGPVGTSRGKYTPRSQVVNTMLNHPGLKKVIYTIFPSKSFVRKFKTSILKMNRGKSFEEAMDKETRERLAHIYCDEINSLKTMLGTDLSLWNRMTENG